MCSTEAVTAQCPHRPPSCRLAPSLQAALLHLLQPSSWVRESWLVWPILSRLHAVVWDNPPYLAKLGLQHHIVLSATSPGKLADRRGIQQWQDPHAVGEGSQTGSGSGSEHSFVVQYLKGHECYIITVVKH